MKTTFSRQFAMIAALLLLCLLITGVSFRFLMLGTIESQNQQTMIRDAEAVAELAEAYDSVGDLQNNFDFHISLSLFTKVGDAEALLCDTDGVIRICSCEKFSCDHIGQTVDPVLLAEIQKDGSWYEETSLSSIYDEPRYLAGQMLLASDGEPDRLCVGFRADGADEEFHAPFVDAVLLRGDRSSDRVDAGRVVPVADAGPSARPDGRRRAPLWPG